MGVRHQGTVIAAGVIDERVEQARRQQARVAGLLEHMPQTVREVLARRRVEGELHAQATLEREELDLTQARLQASVAG